MFSSRLLTGATVIALLVAALLAGAAPSAPAVAPDVTALRTNSADPLCVRPDDVSFNWQLTSLQRNVRQTAHEVRVTSDASRLSDPDVCDSGKVDSSEQVAVVYGGPPLEARTRYTWSVCVRDGTDAASDWSEPSTFQTALAHDDARTGA